MESEQQNQPEIKEENSMPAPAAEAPAPGPEAGTPPAAALSESSEEKLAWPAETLVDSPEGVSATSHAEVQRVQLAQLPETSAEASLSSLEYLRDVTLEAGVELGTTSLNVDRILTLGTGSIVELNQTVGDPVRLLINNNPYALGEVVVIGERFGIRISKLLHLGN